MAMALGDAGNALDAALGGTELFISDDVTIQAAPGATVVLDGGYVLSQEAARGAVHEC